MCEYEDKSIEIIQSEEQRERIELKWASLRNLLNNIKHTIIYVIVVPEERKEPKEHFMHWILSFKKMVTF